MTIANISQTVVVLGTGTMAAGIAAGFLEVGMPLVVLGRSIEKAQATLEQARKLAQTLGAKAPSDVPQESDHTIYVRILLQSIAFKGFCNFMHHRCRTIHRRQDANKVACTNITIGTHITFKSSLFA